MDIQQKIKKNIEEVLKKMNLSTQGITLEHPADPLHGDFATNIALALAKQARVNPRELAEKITQALREKIIEYVEKIEVAGPGFINFYLSKRFFGTEIETILKRKDLYGNSNERRGQKVLVEYTDPNPFKVFHIGHLMANAIGEYISRLIASQGVKMRRMCYQGDVGIHVARAMWALLKHQDRMPSKRASLSERTAFLGECYVEGSTAYESDPSAKTEIEALNKKIFEGKDRKLMKLYKLGRKWRIDHFEEIYKKLGTKFDYYVLESEVVHDGMALVNEFLEKGIFEKSEGAIVFKGEKFDPRLHTRVFVNSHGLATYEAKELGLNTKKWKKVRPDQSIIVTGNEVCDYFHVLLKALEIVEPEAAKVTEHVAHGMLRFADGKMSSRKGNVITGESLMGDVEQLVLQKLADRPMTDKEKKEASEIIAVAAIKYSILKQTTASDIIYDFDKSISFEGDSGPYLLYTAVRAQSILDKAKKEKIKPSVGTKNADIEPLVRQLSRFPEVVTRSATEKSPHYIATYLIETSSLFNAWYASTKIVDTGDPLSPYRLAITQATCIVLENGLKLLGIRIPRQM